MEKYEQLYFGATKALFELVKEQSGHRMELEKTVIKEDGRRAIIAQWLSFALIGAVTTFLGAFFVGLFSVEQKDKIKPTP
jgi:hypothetical protein